MDIKPARHILSFGAGVNSAALLILLIDSGAPLDEVVFADTGGEVPETYEFLEVAQEYLRPTGIPFTTLAHKKNGQDLYANCWSRQVIPSAIWRWSTRDFKVAPLYGYYRTFACHVCQYLAIAYDEFERMRTSGVPYVSNIYPLVNQKVTRQDCIDIIHQAKLPIPVKSGCYFCPFNSFDRWKWLHENHPDLYAKAVALEERSKHFPSQRLTDQVFRKRDTVSLRELPERFTGSDASAIVERDTPCGGECMT